MRLGIVLGQVRGVERQRGEAVGGALIDAGFEALVVPDRDAALEAGATALLDCDPRPGACDAASEAGHAAPPIPRAVWFTRGVQEAGALGHSALASADTVLVPGSRAARAAMGIGIPRSRLRVVPHPLAEPVGPVLRPDVVDGVVGLVAPPGEHEAIAAILRRSPRVRDVIALPRLPGDRDPAFWSGTGRVIDRCSVVAIATASVSGALPAGLLARAVPVVAFDAGATADVIVDGVCGWVVPPRPAAIGQAVDTLLRDRWAREAAGIAGRDRALARHAPATAAALVAGALVASAVSGSHRRVEGARLG